MKVTRTYEVNLPEYMSDDWYIIEHAFLQQVGSSYFDDPENLQVLKGNIAYWLTLQYDVGNFTRLVELLGFTEVE